MLLRCACRHVSKHHASSATANLRSPKSVTAMVTLLCFGRPRAFAPVSAFALGRCVASLLCLLLFERVAHTSGSLGAVGALARGVWPKPGMHHGWPWAPGSIPAACCRFVCELQSLFEDKAEGCFADHICSKAMPVLGAWQILMSLCAHVLQLVGPMSRQHLCPRDGLQQLPAQCGSAHLCQSPTPSPSRMMTFAMSFIVVLVWQVTVAAQLSMLCNMLAIRHQMVNWLCHLDFFSVCCRSCVFAVTLLECRPRNRVGVSSLC